MENAHEIPVDPDVRVFRDGQSLEAEGLVAIRQMDVNAVALVLVKGGINTDLLALDYPQLSHVLHKFLSDTLKQKNYWR